MHGKIKKRGVPVMKKKRRVFLACIMSVMMALVMAVPMSVSGAETDVKGSMSPEAFLAAKDANNTITLTGDVTLTESLTINNGASVIIDLNGHVLSAEMATINVVNGHLEVVGSGTIKENAPYNAPICVRGSKDITSEDYSTVKIGEDILLQGWAGIFIRQNLEDASYSCGVSVEFNGKINSVRDTEGYAGHGIYVNGNIKNTENYPTIVIGEDAEITSLGTGIYAAGYADWFVEGQVKGITAIEIRAGYLAVAPTATIISTGDEYVSQPNSNGSVSDGGAIVVAQHTTKLPIEVEIFGGEITGPVALIADGVQNELIKNVSVEVINGAFEGTVKVENAGGDVVVSGGAFTDLDQKTVKVDASEVAVISDKTETATVVGIELIDAVLDELKKLPTEKLSQITIDITKAGKDTNFEVPAGVEVMNSTGVNINVNDEPLANGDTTTVKPTEPSNPGTGTTDPSTPTTPTNPGTTTSTTPADKPDSSADTGDDFNMSLMLAVMGIAGAATIATLAVGRRKKVK